MSRGTSMVAGKGFVLPRPISSRLFWHTTLQNTAIHAIPRNPAQHALVEHLLPARPIMVITHEVTMEDQSIRRWIWASISLQAVGYLVDIVWHGLLRPGVEPSTVGDMARHLGTVHLPLYIGSVSVLVSVSGALLRQIRRAAPGVALPMAFAGAALSAGAEAWHAFSHLHLDTRHAPIAGTMSGVGFLAVVVAIALSSWARRERRAT